MNAAVQRRAASADDLAILRAAGIANLARLVALIHAAIDFLALDLSGLTVLTEAASGPYVVTPIIAALAGAARVIALTRDSRYATAEQVSAQTRALGKYCGLPVANTSQMPVTSGRLFERIEIYTERAPDLFAAADIVTNLGFVRPLDAGIVASLKPTAVVPLMCEAWEFRPGDVDAAACRARDVPLIGTNESYPGLDVFAYCGWLALKMLFDAQIEVHKSKLVVVSNDHFGPVIANRLALTGAEVRLLASLRDIGAANLAADALIVADYVRQDVIIGSGGDVTAADLAATCPGVTVVQFVGHVDVASLTAAGIRVYPGIVLGPRRMALTLAGLGPRPVIELHAAGLKVGELAARARLAGQPAPDLVEVCLRGHVLGQTVTE
jgi:hypothetical protein